MTSALRFLSIFAIFGCAYCEVICQCTNDAYFEGASRPPCGPQVWTNVFTFITRGVPISLVKPFTRHLELGACSAGEHCVYANSSCSGTNRCFGTCVKWNNTMAAPVNPSPAQVLCKFIVRRNLVGDPWDVFLPGWCPPDSGLQAGSCPVRTFASLIALAPSLTADVAVSAAPPLYRCSFGLAGAANGSTATNRSTAAGAGAGGGSNPSLFWPRCAGVPGNSSGSGSGGSAASSPSWSWWACVSGLSGLFAPVHDSRWTLLVFLVLLVAGCIYGDTIMTCGWLKEDTNNNRYHCEPPESIRATNANLGCDPCPRKGKVLKVTVMYSDGRSETREAKSGEVLELGAPAPAPAPAPATISREARDFGSGLNIGGEHLTITNAWWGNPGDTTQGADVTEKVQRFFQGTGYRSIHATRLDRAKTAAQFGLLAVTALQLSAKVAQNVYSPLALQGADAASQWRLLQPLLPELRAPGGASSSAAATAKAVVQAAAPVVQARAVLQPLVDWLPRAALGWQGRAIGGNVYPVVLFFSVIKLEKKCKSLYGPFCFLQTLTTLPALEALASVMDCSSANGLRLDGDPRQQCYVGAHIGYAVWSAISGGVLAFVGCAVIYSTYDRKELMVHDLALFADLVLKMVVAFTGAWFGRHQTIGAAAISLFATFMVQFVNFYAHKGWGLSNVRSLAVTRLCVYAYLVAVNAGALATAASQSLAAMLPVTLVVLLLGLLPVGCLLCSSGRSTVVHRNHA